MADTTQVLSIRISAKDRAAISGLAKAAGVSISQYLRTSALKAEEHGLSNDCRVVLIELMRNRELLLNIRPNDPEHNTLVKDRVESIAADVLVARAMYLQRRLS